MRFRPHQTSSKSTDPLWDSRLRGGLDFFPCSVFGSSILCVVCVFWAQAFLAQTCLGSSTPTSSPMACILGRRLVWVVLWRHECQNLPVVVAGKPIVMSNRFANADTMNAVMHSIQVGSLLGCVVGHKQTLFKPNVRSK